MTCFPFLKIVQPTVLPCLDRIDESDWRKDSRTIRTHAHMQQQWIFKRRDHKQSQLDSHKKDSLDIHEKNVMKDL